MIVLIGRAEADASRLPELRAALDEMMRATWETTGCLSSSLAVEDEGSETRPAVISIVERWADEASFLSHLKSEELAPINQRVFGAMLSVDAKLYTVSGERTLEM